jgi:hypothetical protein
VLFVDGVPDLPDDEGDDEGSDEGDDEGTDEDSDEGHDGEGPSSNGRGQGNSRLSHVKTRWQSGS